MTTDRIIARTQADMAFLDGLLDARDEIKEHRRNRRQVLRSFNTWLDEAGMRRARERADQAGKSAALAALDIDNEMGF